MTLWLTIFGMVIVTYSVRLSVITLLGDTTLPDTVNRALRLVPPVALSAIIFPALILPDGSLDLSPGNERLLAGIAAALIAWRTRNTLLAIGAGMLLLWALQAIGI
jgi:branched-subunit amino acid transport protein